MLPEVQHRSPVSSHTCEPGEDICHDVTRAEEDDGLLQLTGDWVTIFDTIDKLVQVEKAQQVEETWLPTAIHQDLAEEGNLA